MRPSLPSFTVLTTGFFAAYILHSIYSLITIFSTPTCNQGPCLKSYLNSRPELELMLFVTERPKSTDGTLILHINKFDYQTTHFREIPIDIPKTVRKNGTFYIHTVVFPAQSKTQTQVKKSKPLSLFEAKNIVDSSHIVNRLTQHVVPQADAFNLLSDKKTAGKSSAIPVTHLKTKFPILMLTDELSLPGHGIPNELLRHLKVNAQGQFLPILQQDFLQTRMKDLKLVEEDTLQSNFTFTYSPTAFGKLRFLLQMEAALAQLIALGFSVKDLDEIKGVFADMNLYLLCATVSIGSIHLMFDFLSFKSDVNFWRSHRSMAGLSSRTVLWRAFSQAIVFLYLLDESTSLLVLIPTGIGTLIEFWKVTKVMKVKLYWNKGLPMFKIDKTKTESDAEAKTRQYDEECMRYLSYLLYPLCLIAALYSLLYQPHKSWYSWTISSLVNGVYAFGFLFMLPQLFVNYRLKSVAALPWRAFTYRAFNTFIDDIFAFIITMPTAHRVACFRDDIVFLVYLYQRWLYPVDKSRVDDEEGKSNVMKPNEENKKTQ